MCRRVCLLDCGLVASEALAITAERDGCHDQVVRLRRDKEGSLVVETSAVCLTIDWVFLDARNGSLVCSSRLSRCDGRSAIGWRCDVLCGNKLDKCNYYY